MLWDLGNPCTNCLSTHFCLKPLLKNVVTPTERQDSQNSTGTVFNTPLSRQHPLWECKVHYGNKIGVLRLRLRGISTLVHNKALKQEAAGARMGPGLFPAGKPGLPLVPPKSHWDLDKRSQGIDKGVFRRLSRENSFWLSLIRLRCKEALFYCIHTNNNWVVRASGFSSGVNISCRMVHFLHPTPSLRAYTQQWSLCWALARKHSQWISRFKDRRARRFYIVT